MLIFVLKKTTRALAVLFIVTFATFSMLYGNGPGIARAVLGLNSTQSAVDAEVIRLGLDQPLLTQYLRWLGGVVTGDLGHSFFNGQTVTSALSTRLPVTLSLVVVTITLMAIFSVLIGTAAAVFGGWPDRIFQLLAILGAAVPAFIIAIGLVFAFAVALRWLPATGYISPGENLLGWARSITLPVLALLIGSIAGAASQFRSAVADNLNRDYVRTLRARGVPEMKLIFVHVLRNAAGPGLTVVSLGTISLMGGAVFVELIFALPGIGQLTTVSAQVGDVPLVMGAVLAVVVLVLVVNLLTDVAAAALNPKVRKS